VRTGRLAPDAFLNDWGLRPLPYDPGPDFVQAAAQDRLGPWLDSLPPPYTGYQTLRKGLATYRDIAAVGGWKALAPGEPLKLGATGDPRIAAWRPAWRSRTRRWPSTGPRCSTRPCSRP
jgi:murein L,D-transpeptidase YcbB/YkuD